MKWFGVLFLVLSSYLFGNTLASKEGEKLECIEALINLLEFTKRRMISSGQPLFAIFSNYENKYLKSIGFLEELRKRHYDLAGSWCKALGLLPLDEEAKKELIHFGYDLGNLNLEEQEKSINECLEGLKILISDMKTKLPPKQKSTKTIALLFGVLASIILI